MYQNICPRCGKKYDGEYCPHCEKEKEKIVKQLDELILKYKAKKESQFELFAITKDAMKYISATDPTANILIKTRNAISAYKISSEDEVWFVNTLEELKNAVTNTEIFRVKKEPWRA